MSKLADYLVDEGVVEDISHEGLRALLREQGVSFQRIKTWKQSTDPDFEAKKNRVLAVYAIADGKAPPGPGDPDEVICIDEFGPIVLDNFSPHLTTKTDTRVGDYAAANNIELVYVPFNASWLNRIEAQFTGPRYFALDSNDHPTHADQSRATRATSTGATATPTTATSVTSSTGQTLPDTALVAHPHAVMSWRDETAGAISQCVVGARITVVGDMQWPIARGPERGPSRQRDMVPRALVDRTQASHLSLD